MKLSVVIPSRNEFPQICFTIYSIVHDLETFLKPGDWEIIIVNNCSTDEEFPRRALGGTTDYLMARGMYWNGLLRVVYDPLAGNHSARNKGAEVAKGDYIFISDGHMAYNSGFFKRMLQTCEESGGIVHATINWMGAYPPTHVGYQYTIKLGEEIKGTWSNYAPTTKDWFYIPAQGHCSLMVNRKQFLDFGGYPKYHRTYGGGEFYLNMKWWMFGSNVVCEPRAFGYHLACGRGYDYNHEREYLHNVLYIGKILGMDDWVERAYINWLRHHNKEVMALTLKEAEEEALRGERQFVEKRRKKTFNELICERPWDKMNDAKHGTHCSGLSIFQDTIIPLFQENPHSKEAWDNNKYQEELGKFIDENLKEFVYGRKITPQDSL